MTKRLGRSAPMLALLVLVALPPTAPAAETLKHSGSIVALADEAHSFVLAEVGPWRVRHGATVVTYRTITLTPATDIAVVERRANAVSGYPGDFVESAVGFDSIYLGDFVTVDCRHDGARLLAFKITVMEMPR